jgi:hypothetical protein
MLDSYGKQLVAKKHGDVSVKKAGLVIAISFDTTP